MWGVYETLGPKRAFSSSFFLHAWFVLFFVGGERGCELVSG